MDLGRIVASTQVYPRRWVEGPPYCCCDRVRLRTKQRRENKKGESLMTGVSSPGPVLFCFDGSEGSLQAMKAAGDLISRPADAVVLTVWETIATRLALAGAFIATSSSGDLDLQEEALARSAAEEGALQANEHGYNASPMITESFEGIAKAILDIANEVSASLLVCGQRGRGPIRSALLGSVSHALASHTRFPILIVPEGAAADG